MGKHRIAFIIIVAFVLLALHGNERTGAEESQWLHGPPGGISVTRCPDPGQWLLLYWGGVQNPIGNAAESCAGSDRFWMRRSTSWFGYYPSAPQASDDWIVHTGEASFVHGASPPGGASSIVERIEPDAPSISGPANAATPLPTTRSSAPFSSGITMQTQTATATVVAPFRTPVTPTQTATPAPTATEAPRQATIVPATPAPTQVTLSRGPFALTRASDYRTPFGAYHIVGEVRNNSDSTIEMVRLRATAYDSANNVVATEEANACLGVIPIGGESPFNIPFFQATAGIARYTIDVQARPTTREAPSGLDAGTINVNSSPTGPYRLSGDVKNNSRITYRFVQVCAAFYDAGGNILRVDSTFTNPPTLESRDSGSFELSQAIVTIDTYRLWVTGQP